MRRRPPPRGTGAPRLLPLPGLRRHRQVPCRRRPARPPHVRLTRGRLLAASDDAHAPLVVVINEAAAHRFWPHADPLGARVTIGGDDLFRVVGVVRSVHNAGPARQPLPEAYFPFV